MSRTTDFIRLAEHYCRSLEGIVCEGNSHGQTLAVISFSTTPEYKKGFGSCILGFTIVPYGELQPLENAITPNTAAFLVEPIQGEAGIILPQHESA